MCTYVPVKQAKLGVELQLRLLSGMSSAAPEARLGYTSGEGDRDCFACMCGDSCITLPKSSAISKLCLSVRPRDPPSALRSKALKRYTAGVYNSASVFVLLYQ
jgi:hypothetical protein